MNEAAIIQYITTHYPGVETAMADGSTFFFVDPQHKFPFATLVTRDEYDTVSNLSRPDVFRLNIGVSKETYLSLFRFQMGEDPTAYDFAALNQLMPNPVYGAMYWVCILNPEDATFQHTVVPLLNEAYEAHTARYRTQ